MGTKARTGEGHVSIRLGWRTKVMVTSLRSFDQHRELFQICSDDPGEPVRFPI